MKRPGRALPPWLEMSLVGIATLFFIIVGVSAVWAALTPIPAIENFENRQVAQSTKIYDRTGNVVLYDVHGSMRRTAVPLEQMALYAREAAIATEDDTFYTNAGFRPKAFLRAVLVNLRLMPGIVGQGGSTITQQVVKNALLTQDKTITRKVKEIILALRLTRVYSKDQILQTYLNEIPYGGTVYGIQEASQYFFGVDAKDLDLAQAAYLAALPQAPTYYSPYGNHRDALDDRKNFVLGRMKELSMITQEEHDRAVNEKVEFRDEVEMGIKAPHFVFYIREYLEQKYGVDAVDREGLRVITTLDYDLQQKAETIVENRAPSMLRDFNASNTGLVVIDPKTGQVLTMIGSKGYFDDTIDGKVNVALAHRQPGSSFKPFVYATAFKKGYTPETVVFDLKTQFSALCRPDDFSDEPPCYSPENFDGKFQGPITFRNALAQSVNIPAVKALYLAGITDSINTAVDFGISTLSGADRYGLTLVLGGGEVNLLEMTGAYAVFANDGLKNPPTGILRVEDNRGRVLEEYSKSETRVIDPQIAREISDILSDNVARTPEFGADSPLNFPGYDVADKTGTTNDFRDVWILGYTPSISVGAWAGNNDNTPMQKRIAAFIIAPMWHEVMLAALEKYSSPTDAFSAPAPETDSLPPVLTGNWNTDPTQGVHDILYWVDKDSPRNGRPLNPGNDSQFPRWEYPVSLWAGQNPNLLAGLNATNGQPQTGISPRPADFQIISPYTGAVVPWGVMVNAVITQPRSSDVRFVSYYFNGGLIGVSSIPPYALSFKPGVHGPATLRAIVTHVDGSTAEQSVAFTVQ